MTVSKEIPCLYGNVNSGAPWLWRIPEEIVEHMAEIRPREISKLAKVWLKIFDRNATPWCSLEVTENLLNDLQYASNEAIKANKKAFLYCST